MDKEQAARDLLGKNPLLFDQELEDVYECLDNLRESGVTNMFGAASFVADNFETDGPTAKALLVAWMDTFQARADANAAAIIAEIHSDDELGGFNGYEYR